MSYDNVFTSLEKYNSATDENYLTEAFVFLLNTLLKNEPLISCELLTTICAQNNDFKFTPQDNISILTQETTEYGRPDIKITSPDKQIFIEVKHDSPLGHTQISRYTKALETSLAEQKHVVLLTRFAVDFSEQQEKPYKHIRWYEVYNWLSEAKSKISDAVSIYLIESFNSFLEAKQMSMQKVGWEYINGVPALNNLMTMIEVALEGAHLKVYAKSAGWEFKGFWLEKKEFACLIYYNNPLVITFELVNKGKYDTTRLKKPTYELREGNDRLWFRLPLEDFYFFSLNKDAQLEVIAKFLKTAYLETKQIVI